MVYVTLGLVLYKYLKIYLIKFEIALPVKN